MARRKLKLAFIANQTMRRSCMRKRRRSFVKKVEELSTLCGVQAFCVVLSPDEPGLEVWPADDVEAQHVLMRYITMSEVEQSKKMLDHRSYLEEEIAKAEGSRRAQSRQAKELELACLMDEGHFGKGFHAMDILEATTLSLLVKERLRELRKKAALLKVDTGNASAIATVLGEEDNVFANESGVNLGNDVTGQGHFRPSDRYNVLSGPTMVRGDGTVLGEKDNVFANEWGVNVGNNVVGQGDFRSFDRYNVLSGPNMVSGNGSAVLNGGEDSGSLLMAARSIGDHLDMLVTPESGGGEEEELVDMAGFPWAPTYDMSCGGGFFPM